MTGSKYKSRDMQRHRKSFARSFHYAALVLILILVPAIDVSSNELLYIYAADCAACQQFDAEVLTHYQETEEGRRLPMIKISLATWQASTHSKSICQTQPVNVTPTFIALKNCAEQDRITGYSQAELFWMAIARIEESLETGPTSVNTHKP